jgi:hypothetical protein
MQTVETIENVILQIIEWKNTHPEAIQELLQLEKKLAELMKPGIDGTIATSVIGLALAKLAGSGIAKYWIFPVVFAAGAISAAAIYGLFKWVLSTKLPSALPSPTEDAIETTTEVDGAVPTAVMRRIADNDWDNYPPVRILDEDGYNSEPAPKSTLDSEALGKAEVDLDHLLGVPEDDMKYDPDESLPDASALPRPNYDVDMDHLVGVPEDDMYEDYDAPIPTATMLIITPTQYLPKPTMASMVPDDDMDGLLDIA